MAMGQGEGYEAGLWLRGRVMAMGQGEGYTVGLWGYICQWVTITAMGQGCKKG